MGETCTVQELEMGGSSSKGLLGGDRTSLEKPSSFWAKGAAAHHYLPNSRGFLCTLGRPLSCWKEQLSLFLVVYQRKPSVSRELAGFLALLIPMLWCSRLVLILSNANSSNPQDFSSSSAVRPRGKVQELCLQGQEQNQENLQRPSLL